MQILKSFIIDADVIKAFDATQEYYKTIGYLEQNTIRPTLLVMKKRGSLDSSTAAGAEDFRISLKVSFNPLGDMQIYSTSLLTVRCEYEIKTSSEVHPSNARKALEREVERLKSHVATAVSQTPKKTSSSPENSISNETLASLPNSPPTRIEVTLPNRIKTGYSDLDQLLFGGIPEKYAVAMTSPSCDERDLLTKRFLQTIGEMGQTTFYITENPANAIKAAEEFPINLSVFLCNSRSETIAPNLPNIYKLKGVENLNEIDISLVKAFRSLNVTNDAPKLAVIEIISDVLLQHHAVTTRKWLSGHLADLKSKGFTILAIINPYMHPSEEVQAILGLFEGELRISEKETPKGLERTLRVRKMYNQQYLENDLILKKETLTPKTN